MRQIAWVTSFALAAILPVMGRADGPLRPVAGTAQPDGRGGFGQPLGAPAPASDYKPPKADGHVVELLDDGVDALFPLLINDGGGEPGTIAREDRDAFSGVEAVRVTPMQKYRTRLPGWAFKIVEKPTNAGEFRYLRFAWKKHGGNGLMVQFHDPAKGWIVRYHAGNNVFGWQPSTRTSAKPPTDWEVVTRDLFKDFGALTISGFALSPLDGTDALFDHMLLGRSVEDLDRATAAALGRVKPAKPLAGKERDALWTDLTGTDGVKAAAAQRAFLATAPDQVGFIAARLHDSAARPDNLARVQKLLKDLDADAFDVRDRATDELVELGADAIDAVRALAAAAPNAEVTYRARLVLRKLNADEKPVDAAGRAVRVVRVLERAGTADARALLTRIGEGEFGFAVAPDAKAALDRLSKNESPTPRP